jgi:tetratricopeptide (TPR) repeat protein
MQFSIGKPGAKRRRNTAPLPAFSAASDDGDSAQVRDAGRISSEAAKDKGNMLASGGDFSGALTAFDTAIRLLQADPFKEAEAEARAHREAALHESRAQALLALERDWDAVCAAKRATEMHPAWPEAWVTQGRAQMNLGEPALAVVSFTAALGRDGGHAEAEAELARAIEVQAALTEMGGDARAGALAASRNTEATQGARGTPQGGAL